MSIRNEVLKHYYKKFKEYPDLENPKDFNEKIQWLKLYDQDPLQIILCDKIALKEWVSNKIGSEFVIPAFEGYPSVWKTNHDSYGAEFVNCKDDEEIAYKRLKKRLKKKYGTKKGEWAYRFIEPKILKEKKLSDNTDYKFHCVNGHIKWMQMIYDRKTYGKECAFNKDGELIDLITEPRNYYAPTDLICGKQNFFQLREIAKELSKGWKYVRIDLYYDNNPYVGEITFWPSSGCFERHKDFKKLGNMLDFDTTSKKLQVVE